MLNFRYFDAWLKNTRDGTCNRSAISKFKRIVLFLLALYPHDPSAELYTTDAEFIDEPETRAP